jgi:hypothetical protein
MSCCGHRPTSGRASIASASASPAPTRRSAVLRRAPDTDPPRDPVLEYRGASSLVITGPVTGRTYRFEQPGARLSVSRHDAAALLQAPVLRFVGSHPSRPRT